MNLRLSSLACFITALVFVLSLSSCGDIQQDLIINTDGSGSLETTFDVGQMMSMVNGFSDMGAQDVTISGDTPPDSTLTPTEPPKTPMELIMEKVTDPNYDRDFDTLISLMSTMADSVKQKVTRPDLVDKINIRMKSPAKSSTLTIGIVMNFDNPAQLQEIEKYMESMDKESSPMSNTSPSGLQPETLLAFDADMKAGWIRFDTVDYSGMAMSVGMPEDSIMSGEDMGMVEMMFGSSKIKSIVHVPGEVTSCSNAAAIITKDNKVIIENSLMDVIKKGKLDGYTIHFVPKK